MGSTQSPSSAINAAIDALVMVTNVTGVEATSATTLTVSFNKAISAADQALITFDVKRGTTATTMLAPVWAADGKSVALARSTNLVAGTYTVTASGITFGINAGTAVVEAQKATAMQITTTRVMDADNQSIGYVVTDQYGDTMTVAPGLITVTAFNTTASGRTVDVSGGIADLNFLNTNLDDVVKITAFLTSDSAVKAVKDVTVSNITLGTVTLGEPVLPEDATRFVTGLAGVIIPVSAFDNFGEETQLTDEVWTTATPTTDGLFPVFANTSFTSVEINADGDLEVTLGDAGTATLTVTNPATGDIIVKTITVVAAPDTATIAMTLPEDPIRLGTDSSIPFTVTDQFGEELTVPGAGWANTDVVLASSNTAVATVSWAGVGNNEIIVHPVAEGTTTIFANVVTPVSTGTASLVITVEEGKVPTVISVSGTPKTALAQNEVVAADAETGALAFEIVDQDGEPINLAALNAVGVKANLTVTDANDVLDAPVADVLVAADMSGTVGTTNGIAVDAAAVNGTATVAVQLFNDDGDNVMEAGEALDSQADVVYTVSSQALTAGEFSGVTNATLNADGTAAFSDPAAAASVVTYAFLDQAGNPFTLTAATNVVWTVKNNGTTAITVNDGTAKTLAAGATATYTTTAAIGDANDTISIDTADAKKVDVSAKAAGIATGSDLAIYFYDALVSGVSTYAGTVVAVDTDAQWLVVQTAVGNVVLRYADAVTFDESITYTIDGSTATEAQFDTNLTVGDQVNIAVTGALALSVDLTN